MLAGSIGKVTSRASALTGSPIHSALLRHGALDGRGGIADMCKIGLAGSLVVANAATRHGTSVAAWVSLFIALPSSLSSSL